MKLLHRECPEVTISAENWTRLQIKGNCDQNKSKGVIILIYYLGQDWQLSVLPSTDPERR